MLRNPDHPDICRWRSYKFKRPTLGMRHRNGSFVKILWQIGTRKIDASNRYHMFRECYRPPWVISP